MTEWLIASNNDFKTRDLIKCLAMVGIAAISYRQVLPELNFPSESRFSYQKNAQNKARFLSEYTNQGIIADDSGIEVAALGPHLGVTTKRELHQDVNHSDNETLLNAMAGKSNRNATMVCTLAAVKPDKSVVTATGRVNGQITLTTQGNYSTGFDKIFYLPKQRHTLAELPDAVRIPLTHRGRAAAELAAKLRGD
ncbi:non-canonical purine NTP pyrophosphatase [Secundilactobacillus folii]|uniref:Non-canonical purine NTP pyrophosphatase n=1 Tax=Secundilactobacillus folii TaxID=2678357 RepID=A0A7X2XWB5_9LACO|nr:non-canonical purine NTP pyrophosphatase [Secundilactobacillus folii]MTV82864.1 non-canonical purine NTP pyrophosphatase [Secundilactobacillus folii]